ncbi:hypothetical protein ASG12_14675 [Williamsia sp. Leaf354]|nr:hypothetical protein ASG12_14675 [Williamsia sp. Leaf354]
MTTGTVPGLVFFFFWEDGVRGTGGADGVFVELVFGAGRGLSVAITAFRFEDARHSLLGTDAAPVDRERGGRVTAIVATP